MAKIDRFRSPEEAERLADLKRGVNLVALATERYGLTITEKSRDERAYTLENKAAGERITVKVGPEGYHIYNNHNDSRDKGSVVDFLQQRHPDRNLGQVKGMLQEMVPGAKSALDYEKFQAQQVQKAPSAADARYEALPPDERRAAMVRETMGPSPQLTDASYLLERGLSKETVNDPAFRNRVFTDQHPERQERLGAAQHNVGFPLYNEKGVQSWELRNRAPEGETDSFKMMMKSPGDDFGAKNGVWSSNLLQGRGSQPERMVIGESPIDMMSKFQTEKAAATEAGQELPNSRYVATGGTPSIEQKAIIQAIIDREQPRQIILSNDNDAAGQAFNVRYLNDLRPPVAGLSPGQQQEAAAARERTTWIAGDNGKKGEEKLLTMTISLQTGTAKEGRGLVEGLRTQAEMRGLPAEEPGTPGTAGLQVRRNAPEVTEVVLRVAPEQAAAVVDLARELRREREQAMPEAARTPENYFVVEKANGKDYNQDILQGRADAQLDAARREAGFTTEQTPTSAAQVAPAEAVVLEQPRGLAERIAENNEKQSQEELRHQVESALLRLEEKTLARAQDLAQVATPTNEPYSGSLAEKIATNQEKQSQEEARHEVESALLRLEGKELAKGRETTGPEVAAAPEVERSFAQIRVTDNEPLPAGVQAPDDRFRSLAQEVRSALEESGLQVATSPVPGAAGPLVRTYLEFEYAPGSPQGLAAQQIVADVKANAPGRVDAAGIEPAGEAQAQPRFAIGLPLEYAPVALQTSPEASPVLEARLYAGELNVLPTQINNEPGFVVLLDRSSTLQAAQLERVIDLHQQENVAPLTLLQSEATATDRRQGVEAFYDPERGAHTQPPALTAYVLALQPEAEVQERLTRAGATVEVLSQSNEEQANNAAVQVRIGLPLDQPEVVASASRVMEQMEVVGERRWDAEAREQLTQRHPDLEEEIRRENRMGAQAAEADFERSQRQSSAPEEPVLNRLIQDPNLDYTKLGYPGSATAAVGYPGTEEAYKQQLVEAGASLIERPVSELAPAGTQSISYPLDQPEVVARVSNILTEIEAVAIVQPNLPENVPVGVFELEAYRQTRIQAEIDYAPERVATPQISADINNNGSTSAEEIIRADRNRDGVVSGSELEAARFDAKQGQEQSKEQQPGTEQKAPDQIAADINLNGSTSQAEILRADANRDGVVTGTELNQARFEINQANERGPAELTDTERKEAAIRRYNELSQQQAEADAQQQQAPQRDTSGELRSAAIVLVEAETLPAGTLAAGSATALTLGEKMRAALEDTAIDLTLNPGRDKTTGEPYSMVSFKYHEGSAEHEKVQEVLRDAIAQGRTKYFGIEPGEERQRETEPLTRSMALNEQPLAIALDAPNPLLESQLRATGAAVSNEPVQDRPGLVVVVNTDKGEQLAGVEQTLTKLPAAAVVVEGPEATEMRQQLTQTFREQGGVAPALQAEAILPERIQNDVPERLREAGATVAPVVYADRPDNSLSVRYPLDQPEVMGRVSVVLDQVNSRSAQIALDLGTTPDGATGSVVETPLAQQTRQLVAKEQGMEGAGPRELPAQQPTEDRTIDRPKSVVIVDSSEQVQAADAKAQPVRTISAEPEPHAVERRIILDVSNEKPGLAPTLEAALTRGGFQVATAPIEAVGEEKGGTRIEALYRTTDALASREQQAGELRKISKMDPADVTLREPDAQAQERALALKGPGKPEANQLVGGGQSLRATLTVLEVDGEKERAGRLWTDLRSAGGQMGKIGQTDMGAEGTKFAFFVEYRPSDVRLPVMSATLEAAARGEGIQVQETDNMRLERLSRTSARETKQLAEMTPEAREIFKRPESKDYSASRPDAYERVAVSAQELASPGAMKALREELKETGAVVAVQQLDGRTAGSGTVTLSFVADSPKAEAVNQVLRGVAEKGATVYDLKAGHDRGAEPQVAVEAARGPLTAEQERQANLAELQTLEARRDALRASQQEATSKSQLAEQYLVPAAAVVAVEAVEAKAPWVGFGPDLRGEDLRNTDATGMDLRGANLAGQDLRSTDLRGSDLREANLTGVDFRGTNLTGVRLEGAVMDDVKLEQSFRVVENEGGKRQMEENLTPALLTGPEREGSTFATTVAMNEQRLATPEMVAAGEDNSPAAAPRMAMLQAPQYSGLSVPTEAEMRQQQVEEPQAALLGGGNQPLPPMPSLQVPSESELSQMAQVTPPAELVMTLPAVAATSQEPGKGQATAEIGDLEVTAPVAAPGTLSRYEQLEEAGTTLHTAAVYITQPVGEAGVEKADGADPVKQIQERLVAAGAEVEVSAPTLDASGKTETSVLTLVYTHDDRELPAVHQALNEVATVPAGADFGVRVADDNAAGRAATVESRMENTPEAAKALAAELHDGSDTARVLVQRPALEDVWALEDAGAKIERIYLPDGPAAMVSYPANEPGVTSAVSIELDRIERDSTLTRPPHNSNDREVSGPLLGEDPAQQERRQGMAQAEGLVLEPNPRYEANEMAERDARAKAYFQEEIARPSDALAGQLANGEPFKGGITEVLRLEQPDRDALEASWKAEKTTLFLVVQETPSLRMDEAGPSAWPERVAEALREAGAETRVRDYGVSADTGLEKHLVAVSFDNNDPALARIQATLNRLADQDGVQVPAEGYWQREAILGPNGSRMAEPVVAERDRPWLEAVVAISEPTAQERRELSRAGARIEDAQFEGSDNKPAILVYYNLDKPAEVARVSDVLDRVNETDRGKGETYEAGQARGGRAEQYQQDVRQEKQQDGAAWEQLSQKYPGAGAKVENEVGEPAVALSFADRIRAAVKEQVEYVRQGWESGSPENIAVYLAEQRGIADRKALEQQQAAEAAAAPQKEREKEAYERGFNGPNGATPAEADKTAEKAALAPTTTAEVAAAAALAGGVAPGTNGTSAELAKDQILRERRDDELTKPVVMDAPKEGKILETTEQVVKAPTVGTPDQEKAAGEKAVTPPVVETPAVAAAVVTAQVAEKPREQELQYGIIGMGDSSKSTAEERMERVRLALQNAGASVEAVVPPTRDNKDASLAYAYDPLDKKLPEINTVLTNVQTSQPSMIKEEPHSLHYAGIKPNAHEIERRDWPEREGQFAKASIVVDDFDQKGTARAENIKGDLAREGAIVGEVKKDGHGHVEVNVTYHTHSPNIEQINNKLDKAGNSAGVEVRELDTDRTARYQGAIDQLQTKGAEKERERGE